MLWQPTHIYLPLCVLVAGSTQGPYPNITILPEWKVERSIYFTCRAPRSIIYTYFYYRYNGRLKHFDALCGSQDHGNHEDDDEPGKPVPIERSELLDVLDILFHGQFTLAGDS